MIDARELRLGNLLWNPVQGIAVPVDLRLLSDIVMRQKANLDIGWQPIPLTEQWLFDFGFNRKDYGEDSYKYWIGINPVTHDWLFDLTWLGGEEYIYPFYRNGFHEVKSVHQLQNLYFALTGEELTKK